ncbi:hypothetical protein PISL3812_09732 [Talaromyces islandicus]|uniref:Uncharacterized protein n=1 Tax=Talaromyces islandicus TaxID=28573 RepID=A0A0U1MAP2_TALIS|nr:hypothetical protein PISL3812_09732 [Talaromyces islandicus]
MSLWLHYSLCHCWAHQPWSTDEYSDLLPEVCRPSLQALKDISQLIHLYSITSDVFSFMCKDNQYGCHATATPGVVWTGVMTNIGLPTPTEEPATRTPSTAEGIEAWGIKLLSVASATSSTSSPLTTKAPVTPPPTSSFPSSRTITSGAPPTSSGASGNSEESSDKGGLAPGAVAGIAIGKRTRQDALPPSYTAAPFPKNKHELDGHDAPQLLDSQQPGPRIWELDG